MNNKLTTWSALIAMLLTTAATARSSIIISEDFDYTIGSLLAGRGGWSNGGGSGSVTVSSPTLTPFSIGTLKVPAAGSNEVTVSGKTLFRGLGLYTSNNTSDTYFVSFIAKVAPGSVGFGGIRLKNTKTNVQMLAGQLFRADKSTFWGLNAEGAGIAGDGAGIKADYSDLPNTKPALLVVVINYTGSSMADISLYVNPIIARSPGSLSLLSTPAASLSGITLGRGFNQIQVLANADSTLAVDAVRVGTTLADVLPPEAAP